MTTSAPQPLPPAAPPVVILFGPFRFDLDERTLTQQGELIALPPRALEVLAQLLKHHGRLVEKEALMDAVWGAAHISDAVLKEAIFLIRRALGDDPKQPAYIQTVHRRGYRFVAPLDPGPAAQGSAVGPTSDTPSDPVPQHPSRSRHVAALLAAVAALVLTLATVGFLRQRHAPSPPPTTHLTVDLPAGHRLWPVGVALSADGRQLVFCAKDRDGPRRLYRRRLDAFQAQPIAGSEGASRPFLSPDGLWVGFFAAGALQVLPIEGGVARRLAVAPDPLGGVWGADGNITFASGENAGLARVRWSGGGVETLSRPTAGRGEQGHRWPWLLPGGRLLLTLWRGDLESSSLAVREPDGRIRELLVGGSAPFVDPSGQLFYGRPGRLMAAPFDLARGRLLGPGVPVLEGVRTSRDVGSLDVALAADGTLAYQPAGPLIPPAELAWIDLRDGSTRALPVPADRYLDLALAPAGQRAALTRSTADGRADIWLVDLERGTRSPLTFAGDRAFPVWTPDGRSVVVAAVSEERSELYAHQVDGTRASRLLATHALPAIPEAVLPGGKALLVRRFDSANRGNFWSLPLAGEPGAVSHPLLDSAENTRHAAPSPDGRWLAYAAHNGTRWDVFVRPLGRPGGLWQLSLDGGSQPRWSTDGERILFRAGRQLVVADVRLDSGFEILSRRAVLTLHDVLAFDLAPDGGRLLILRRAPDDSDADGAHQRLRLILGWRPELVPANGA